MRKFLPFLAALSLAAGNAAMAAETQQPNIIVILTDDMGYGELTSYGNGAGVPTPNIDRLAKEGARFTQYYSPAPISSPSRAGMLTGQFPGRNRLNSYLQTRAGNRNCEQADFLDASVATLPDALKAAGYATAHYGKWHLGGGRDVDNAPSIGEYGYDEWASTWESPEPHPDLGVEFAPWDRRKEPNQVVRDRRTEYMVDRTLGFLMKNEGKPCFINLWPDDMHTPFRPSDALRREYGGAENGDKGRNNFLAVLEEYDRQVGRLLDGLEELGIEDNTVVIFTSDNGPEPHYNHERTGGLRGMKVSLFEGGIRMPFLIRWPGHVPAGHVDTTSLISGLDIPLTICALAGANMPENVAAASDGQDVSAALLGEPMTRTEPLFWEYGRKQKGYGYPRLASDRSPNLAIRDGEWKLLVNEDGTGITLFNIIADPKERNNVANQHEEIADKLAARVIAWRKTLP